MSALAAAAAAPAFGAFPPSAFHKAVLSVTRRSAPTRTGRLWTSPLRRLVMATMRSPVDVETFGAKTRLYPHDNLADKRALIRPRLFDAEERAAIAAAMHPRFVFIDAGANTGLYSLFVAALAGPAARVLAIEPQPIVKERLAFNILANGYETVITHADIALADGPGEAELQLAQSNKGQAGLKRGAHAEALTPPRAYPDADHPTALGDTVRVATIGLYELMDYQGIERADALKIDIEGAEDLVMPAFFERCPPERLPLMIIMETLSRSWTVDCVQLAKDNGYQTHVQTPRNIVLRRH